MVDPKLEAWHVEEFVDGLAIARMQYKVGVVDESLNWVVPPRFGSIKGFKDGVSWGNSSSSKTGLLDLKGKWIIKPQFAIVTPFQEGLAWVCRKEGPYVPVKKRPRKREGAGRFGLVDSAGHTLITARFTTVCGFRNGATWVETTDKKGAFWGLIDKTGRFLLEPIYENLRGIFWYQDWSSMSCTSEDEFQLQLGGTWLAGESVEQEILETYSA